MENHPAMDYTGARPEQVASVTRVDLIRFFIDFLQNNQVGVIANAHVRSLLTFAVPGATSLPNLFLIVLTESARGFVC
jgi:hypothetical protein